MLVRCSWCKKTFNADRYGRQSCPHCRAELDVPVPEARPVAEPPPAPPAGWEGAGGGTPEPPSGSTWVGGRGGATEPPPGGSGVGGAGGEQAPPPGSRWVGGAANPPSASPGAWTGAPQGGWGGSAGGSPPPGGPPPGDGVPPGGGTPPGGWYPPGGAFPPGAGMPQDEDAPWERRETLGFFPALVETWKLASLEPKRFYARLKTRDIGPAFLYALIMTTAGYFFGGLWSLLLSSFTGTDPGLALGQLVAAPFFAAIGIFLGAGVIHLGCMLFGCADKGFDATFRAVAYAQGPQILAVIPFIGGLGASIWAAILSIVGIAAMQRTTAGKATGAVLLPGLLVFFCCLFVVGAGAALMAGGLAGMQYGP